MFSNYAVRAVLVDYLKNYCAIIGVPSIEVREKQWQGTQFTYPNIRVRMIFQKPSLDNCDWADLQVSVQCYSEMASSQESETIELAVANLLDKKTISSNGIKIYSIHCAGMIDANRIDERIWVAEVMFTAKVQAA